MYKTDGKEERMSTLAMEIHECDDRELGKFPCCDFYFPSQVGKKHMLRVRELKRWVK